MQRFDENSWVIDAELFEERLVKWQNTVNIMADIFQAPGGFIVQYTDKGYQIVVANESELNPYPAGDTPIPPETNIFCKKVVAEGRAIYVNNATELDEWDDNPEVSDDGFNSYLGLPLYWPDGNPFGTICVMDYKTTDYQETYLALMEQFRDLVGQDLELLDQYLQVQELSIKDHLTGCYNRRGFYEIGENCINLARRQQQGIGLLYFDMDGLKKINDEHGHDAGDEAIAAFGAILERSVRDVDVAARLGGDEFAVMALMNDAGDIGRLLDRVDHELDKLQLMFPVSASSGYKFYDANNIKPLEKMLHDTDILMYQNKNGDS